MGKYHEGVWNVGGAQGVQMVRVVQARWVARSWSLIVRVYVDCRDDILIRRVNQKECVETMILCVETMIRHFHLSMLLQWYHLVLEVQLVISTMSLVWSI